MITFLVAILLLVAGYLLYGRFIEKFAGVSADIQTPVKRLADGVDYAEIKPWKIFVIQFLNIAGLGPIFGAILGAAYGPAAYIWIVVGCIFMGAVHDFFSGFLSLRNDGASIPILIGKYLGKWAKTLMGIFTGVLLLAVGASFVSGPADLLTNISGLGKFWWVIIIFAYYLLATLLPVDKLIGKIYPFMGVLLLFMAFSIGIVMLVRGFSGSLELTELTLDTIKNQHSNPEHNILIPMLFIVISCGAISGFHSTQSPMMARCMANEKYARPIFYGAMISEGIVALIWATAAIAYFGGPDGLNAAAAAGKTPAIMVNEICNSWLGKAGAIIALLGIVVCPITSGDTAFRSLRLLISDQLHINQKPLYLRLAVAAPIFILAYLACRFDFSLLWRYVGISNQILAALVLWTISSYLAGEGKCHWVTTLPALFVTYMSVCYLMVAQHNTGGFALSPTLGYIIAAAVTLIIFFIFARKKLIRRC